MVEKLELNCDAEFMGEALSLARSVQFQTSPNPTVGALVVSSSGDVVGRGFHEGPGLAHAEVSALDQAGQAAKNGTLYCTLEPCTHLGRTAPCVSRILAAEISRVVIAIEDPNPNVSGGGVSYLREQGLQVDVGVRRLEALKLNEYFFRWALTGRPFVIMKIALSSDGRIAERIGSRTQLTAAEASRSVHKTRCEVDALGVGSNTVIVDDPKLSVRGFEKKSPLTRVVFDRRLRVSPAAKIFQSAKIGPVVVLTSQRALEKRGDLAVALREAGGILEPLSSGSIAEALRCLGRRGITSLLIEGGTCLHRAVWTDGFVDRVQQYVSPIKLGVEGVDWLDRRDVGARLESVRKKQLGRDLLLEGDVQRLS
tara:strand:- start:2968 stop:4071 length:1104 start_codon:yes stop_codon:yes gene_type:complete